jgi:hypothetical protein
VDAGQDDLLVPFREMQRMLTQRFEDREGALP